MRAASWKIELLPAILRRVADAIEPFDFQFVQDRLLLPVPDGIGDRFGELANLSDQLDNGPINELEQVHDAFLAAAGRRSSRR